MNRGVDKYDQGGWQVWPVGVTSMTSIDFDNIENHENHEVIFFSTGVYSM